MTLASGKIFLFSFVIFIAKNRGNTAKYLGTRQVQQEQKKAPAPLRLLSTVEPLGTDTSIKRTPLYYGQFPMSRQNVHIFSFKKPSIIDGLSVIRTTDTKSQPQRVNSYELNLFITDTAVIEKIPNPDKVNLHKVNPV